MTFDSDLMRIWITGDLHGQRPTPPKGRFDAIICPGDVGSDAAGKHMFAAMRQRTDPGKEHLQWFDIIGKREATRMVRKSIADGRAVLQYLNSFGVPVYVVPGNWDWSGSASSALVIERRDWWPTMTKGLRNVRDVDCTSVDGGSFSIIGYGRCYGPEIPQYKDDRARLTVAQMRKREREYLSTMKGLGKLFVKAKKPVILLTHNVPYNTPLDMIDNPASPRNGRHYGSLVARDLIKKHQPLLAIGGHMHEHYATYKMGKTIALNTGFGPGVRTILEISGGKIVQLELCDPKGKYRKK